MLICNAIQALKRIIDSDIYGIEYNSCDDYNTIEEFIKSNLCDYVSCIEPIYCEEISEACIGSVYQEGFTQEPCGIVIDQIYETTFT